MTMKPGGEKVAWGMARANLFDSLAAAATCGEVLRDGGRTLAIHCSALSIRPAKWFGADWPMNSFFARQDCAVPDDFSGVPVANLVCRTATDQNRLKID
jgi:hypothetical protein